MSPDRHLKNSPPEETSLLEQSSASLPSLPWDSREISRLRSDPRFIRAEKAYERVVERYTNEHGAALDPKAGKLLKASFEALSQYSKVLLLEKQGLALEDLAPHLHPSKVREWLKGRIPAEIYHYDPNSASREVTKLKLSEDAAPSRSGFLAAFASVIRAGSRCEPLCFVRRVPEALQLLQADLESGFGIRANIRPIKLKGEDWFRLTASGQALVEYTREHTGYNRRVPWENLLTSAERRAYLSRLIAFSCTEKGLVNDRLEFTKNQSFDLVQGIAVIFKREGLYPRISGSSVATVGFYDPAELRRLSQSGIVGGSLGSSLSKYTSNIPERPNIVQEFLIAQEIVSKWREPTITAAGVRKEFERRGLLLQSEMGAVAGWLRGHTPLVVQRYQQLVEIERGVITPDDLKRVGSELKSRQGNNNPFGLMQRIVEFHGGYDATAAQTGVTSAELQRWIEKRLTPTRSEYLKMLASVGIGGDQAILLALNPPRPNEIYQALKGNPLQRHFTTYQGSVMHAADKAYREGADPISAGIKSLKEVVKRHKDLSSRRE